MIIRSMIGHVKDVLSTYGSDAITPIVLLPDMVYANLWALRHSYSFRSVSCCHLGLTTRASSQIIESRGWLIKQRCDVAVALLSFRPDREER